MDDTIRFFKYQHSTVYWMDDTMRFFKYQHSTVYWMDDTIRFFKYQHSTVYWIDSIVSTAQVDVSNDSIAQSSTVDGRHS